MAFISSDYFEADNLMRNLTALQQEKGKLNGILRSVGTKRKNLIEDSMKTLRKLSEITGDHQKLLDQIKILENQISREEFQIKSLNRSVTEIQRVIEKMEKCAKFEEKNMVESLDEFEEQVDQLAELFKNAEFFYCGDNLTIEMDAIKTTTKMLNKERNEHNVVIANLLADIKKLKAEGAREAEMPELQVALELFREENKLCHLALEAHN